MDLRELESSDHLVREELAKFLDSASQSKSFLQMQATQQSPVKLD